MNLDRPLPEPKVPKAKPAHLSTDKAVEILHFSTRPKDYKHVS
jgi:hypothetical protein